MGGGGMINHHFCYHIKEDNFDGKKISKVYFLSIHDFGCSVFVWL